MAIVGVRVLAFVAALAAAAVVPALAVAEDSKPDWREQNAYTLGVRAYLYAFPWAYMPQARWDRTEPIDRQADRFFHVRKLEDATHLTGGAPNNDTLYSRAWVYLKDEPVILTVPEIADRYYTMEIVDFMGDNFAYVGTRATGAKAGKWTTRALSGCAGSSRLAMTHGKPAMAGDVGMAHVAISSTYHTCARSFPSAKKVCFGSTAADRASRSARILSSAAREVGQS